MTKMVLSSLIGYLIGSLSPSALLAKIKKQNLKEQGTGNLGATNTMLILGKSYGAFVMLLDIFKAFAASRIAVALFPELKLAGLLSGVFSVVGHVFPFYLKFRGGKGLAAFGGMILAFDPLMFLLLLALTLTLMFVFNYGVAMPFSAAILFPVLALLSTKNLAVFALALAAGLLLVFKHLPNLKRALKKEDKTVRDYMKKLVKH